MPLPYCAPEDLARKLDMPPDRLDLQTRRQFAARAGAASQAWDSSTGSPMRTVRSGAADAPATWEHHDARNLSGRPPVHVSLDHTSIVPVDASAGDTIEVRTGRDTWDDVTDEQGDSWTLDHRRGQLKIYRFLINRLYFEHQSERFLRVTYRHGGLGGDRDRGATTALASSVGQGDTTLSLADSGRLPTTPFLAGLGTGPDFEYVRVTAIDRGADEATVDRGVRQTDQESHDADATLHYAPEDVREAVAAKAAELLILEDDAVLSIPDDGQLSSRTARADRFAAEFETAASQYSAVRTL